ncbi:unnamed protein product [Heterosigma akashiwo]
MAIMLKAYRGMLGIAKSLGFSHHISLLQEQPSKKIQRCYQKWNRILNQVHQNPRLLDDFNEHRFNAFDDLLEDVKYILSEASNDDTVMI